MSFNLRAVIGTLLLDRPRCAWVAFAPGLASKLGKGWIDFHNRGESIRYSPDRRGIECPWQWSNDLNIGKFLPAIGAKLFSLALSEWPVSLASIESVDQAERAAPRVSFVIGHRGSDRVPHLRATIQSILGQRGIPLECIVVEQSRQSVLSARDFPGVRIIAAPPPNDSMPYSRSWAFNVGAHAARGEILVLHDNDILVPADYANELAKRISAKQPVARLQRFIFYLSHTDSQAVFDNQQLPPKIVPEAIRQNCQGGTLAVWRDTYFSIGGHDESFLGWGGEDNEMFDRCQAVGCFSFGYLPFIHLYHAPQPRPNDGQVFQHLQRRLAIPARQRIAELSSRPMGQLTGPGS